MKICIVGTHKSGSTRLFKLIRLMFEKKGKKFIQNGTYWIKS